MLLLQQLINYMKMVFYVDYKNFETNYDGEQLQAEYQDNNTIYYTKLNNDELSKNNDDA